MEHRMVKWFGGLSGRQRQPAQIPLRLAFVIPWMLQIVVTVGLVGYLSYRSGQAAIEALAQRLMDEVGDSTTIYLEKSLAAAHLVNQLNADAIRLGYLPGFETQDPDPLEKFFWQQLQRFPTVSTIAIANERGGMIGSGRVSAMPSLTVYRTSQFAKGTFSVSLTDSQGNATQPKRIAENYDARTRPWYQTPVRAGKAAWSPIYQYVSPIQILGISAGLPIYTPAGKLQGVLATDLTLEKLNEFLADRDISQSGQVFIIERSGLLVATSTDQPLFTPQQGKLERVKATESKNLILRAATAQLYSKFGSLTSIQTTQQLEFDQAGERQFLSVSPFRDRAGLDWLVVVVVPESDFMGQIHQNTRATVLLSGGALLVAIALGSLISQILVRPMRRLSQASQALAAGNWHLPTAETTPIAELQTLTHGFNQTATQLQQSFDRVKMSLQASEAKFTTILRASPDPIALNALESGQFLEVNDSFLHFLESSREAVIGRTSLDLQISADLNQDAALQRQLRTQGCVKGFEYRYRSQSGRVGTILLSIEVISLDGQTVTLSVMKEISDRKRMEASLSQSEQWLDQVNSLASAVFYTLVERPGIGLQFEYISSACEGLTEHSAAAIMAEPNLFYDQIHPDDRAHYAATGLERTAMLQAYFQESRMMTPSGKVCWIQSRSQPERRPDGSTVWHGVLLDITERKRTAAALLESETQFRQIAEHLKLLLFVRDVGSGQFLYASPAYETIWGRTCESLYQDPDSWLETVHPEDRERLSQMLAQKVKGQAMRQEYRILRPDGTVRWIESQVFPVLDENGKVKRFVGCVEDISDRHAIDQLKDEFIGIVSHELRTPLTAIRGALGLLATGIYDNNPTKFRHMIEIASKDCDRLGRLVNDMLDLERLDSGKKPLTMEVCEVAPLLQQAVESVQILAQQAAVTLQIQPITAQVWAAPDAILQTLTNLLSNAIKFSEPNGTVWLKVESVEQTSAVRLFSASSSPSSDPASLSYSPSVQFSVKDQGRGIPANKLESIFDRFQQVDVSDSRQKGGTGLGLAICRAIVEQHGGKIWAESQLGHGSTFYFTLPTPANFG